LLVERLRKIVGDRAGKEIGGAAGCEGVDDADRLVRPVLRGSGCRAKT
jgi:hypothetical protein